MIKFFLLVLFILFRTTLGAPAPVYGEDGGYVGYAGYDPSRGRRGLSGESAAVEVENENTHPGSSRRNNKGDSRRGAPIAPPLAASHHVNSEEELHFDFVRLHAPDDYLSKTSGKNTEPLKNNYIVPHYDTLFGHKGYKISDIAPKVEKNVYSADYHPEDQIPYEYGYAARDEHGNIQAKKEYSNGQKVRGSYGFMDERGLFRKVDYVADEEGFKARVRTNEPGTGNQNPADVLMESEHDVHER